MADLVLSVTYFGILLGLGIIVANLLKKARIPDTFFLLLLGLLLGPTLYLNPAVTGYISTTLVDVSQMGNVPDFLRTLALIMVVFTGTFNLGLRAFKRFGNMAVNIAIVGVIFNTLVMGLIANMFFGFDIVYSFLMAAVVSGTCTSVVFAFEDSLKGARKALNVIKVESILNSPLSVLLPVIFLDLVAIAPGAIIEPMKYLSQFWVMIAVGVGAGLIVGLGISRILKGMLKEYTPLMLFAVALVTYALAENVGGSGMLAVAVCGLIAGSHIRQNDTEVQKFDDHLSEMLRISVFTLLGAQVTLLIGMEEFLVILLFFLIMFFIRPVFLFPVLGKGKKDFDRREFLIMSFITPRGLSAAAMAPIVAGALIAAGSPDVAGRVMNIIFLVIMLSVIFSTAAALLVGRIRERPDEPAGKGKAAHKENPSKEGESPGDKKSPEGPEEKSGVREAPEKAGDKKAGPPGEEKSPPSSVYI
jgi:cell volume regulation protein A